MTEVKYISFSELQKIAKRETMNTQGRGALIENYAKRRNMTYEEDARELGYKDTRGVHACIARGSLEKDGKGGVTDESVAKRKKKPVSPIGMTDEKFSALDDDEKIVVTKKMIRELAEILLAEARGQYVPVSLGDLIEIAKDEK